MVNDKALGAESIAVQTIKAKLIIGKPVAIREKLHKFRGVSHGR